MLQKKRGEESLCLSHSAVMASLSVIKGTFESEEPIRGASMLAQPRCLTPPPLSCISRRVQRRMSHRL